LTNVCNINYYPVSSPFPILFLSNGLGNRKTRTSGATISIKSCPRHCSVLYCTVAFRKRDAAVPFRCLLQTRASELGKVALGGHQDLDDTYMMPVVSPWYMMPVVSI